MSYIDALIPGCIGLVVAIWPKMFLSKEREVSDRMLRRFRMIGFGLMSIACVYLVIALAGKQ